MLLRLSLLILLLSNLLTSAKVMAQDDPTATSPDQIRYISDELFTYMHAGPGRNFRIIGSVTAGTQITQLQIDTDNGYIEIIDDKQRTGWVEAKFISNQISIRSQVPELKINLSNALQQLSDSEQENGQLSQQLDGLSAENARLKRQLGELQVDHNKVKHELSNLDNTEKMELFTRGGIIAVVSLLLGIIVTFLPKRKQRNDEWV